MIVLNGVPSEVPTGSLLELLEQHGLEAQGVAVAVNGEVVPRSDHGEVTLRTGDVVDVVSAVPGG